MEPQTDDTARQALDWRAVVAAAEERGFGYCGGFATRDGPADPAAWGAHAVRI